jgi:hypothetical protein
LNDWTSVDGIHIWVDGVAMISRENMKTIRAIDAENSFLIQISFIKVNVSLHLHNAA